MEFLADVFSHHLPHLRVFNSGISSFLVLSLVEGNFYLPVHPEYYRNAAITRGFEILLYTRVDKLYKLYKVFDGQS